MVSTLSWRSSWSWLGSSSYGARRLARTLAAEPFFIVATHRGDPAHPDSHRPGGAALDQLPMDPSRPRADAADRLVIVMTVAIVLWRRFYIPAAAADVED
jgi:hypothetical protein